MSASVGLWVGEPVKERERVGEREGGEKERERERESARICLWYVNRYISTHTYICKMYPCSRNYTHTCTRIYMPIYVCIYSMLEISAQAKLPQTHL